VPTAKITAFFRDSLNNIGWTENWYSASSGDSITFLNNWDSSILAPRKALANDTIFIDALRMSLVDHPRDSVILSPVVNNQGTVVSATHKPVGPWDALLIRQESTTYNVFSHTFLRGTNVDIYNGRTYLSTGTWPAAYKVLLDAYYNALVAGTALLRKNTGGTITYPPLNSWAYLRRTERKAGRPFDPLRGRRAVA
jgi:hypothetical protein